MLVLDGAAVEISKRHAANRTLEFLLLPLHHVLIHALRHTTSVALDNLAMILITATLLSEVVLRIVELTLVHKLLSWR